MNRTVQKQWFMGNHNHTALSVYGFEWKKLTWLFLIFLECIFQMLGNYTKQIFHSVLNSHKWTCCTSLVQAQKQVEYQNNINTKIAWNFKSLPTISSYWYITLDDLQMQYYIIHQISFLSLHIGAKVVQKSLNKKNIYTGENTTW